MLTLLNCFIAFLCLFYVWLLVDTIKNDLPGDFNIYKFLNSKKNPFGNFTDSVPHKFAVGFEIDFNLKLFGKVYWSFKKWFHFPYWLRQVLWWARNPLHNFGAYWIGYRGWESAPYNGGVFDKNGFRIMGYYWHERFYARIRKRPFLSYRGKYIECYIGWRPNGIFGFAFRKAKATGY